MNKLTKLGAEFRRAMTPDFVLNVVFVDAILEPVLRELGLPNLSLSQLEPTLCEYVLREAESLQSEALEHPLVSVLREYGLPLTIENYLAADYGVALGKQLFPEEESELPDIFKEAAIEDHVSSVMQSMEIDEVLRRLSLIC
jgi:hypothetical protein